VIKLTWAEKKKAIAPPGARERPALPILGRLLPDPVPAKDFHLIKQAWPPATKTDASVRCE